LKRGELAGFGDLDSGTDVKKPAGAGFLLEQRQITWQQISWQQRQLR
jgi:hypothetical protein